MAWRDRVRRLNKVDLPTFGRPTRAITGTGWPDAGSGLRLWRLAFLT
jgi:hypothetical protein